MVNEVASQLDLKRCGLIVGPDQDSSLTTQKVFEKTFGGDNMPEEVKERKPLPKFPVKIRMSQFGSLEVTIFLNAKYIKKVLNVKIDE